MAVAIFAGVFPPSLMVQTAALPQGVTEEMVRAGEQLFKSDGNCSVCHGEDATGARGVGANLTDDEWWHSDGSYEAILRTIGTGVPSDKVRNAFRAMMPPRGGIAHGNEQDNQAASTTMVTTFLFLNFWMIVELFMAPMIKYMFLVNS